MHQRFEEGAFQVCAWTEAIAHERHIWLYTIDDRFLAASGHDFSDDASAIEAARLAVRQAVGALAAQGVKPISQQAGVRRREAPPACEELDPPGPDWDD